MQPQAEREVAAYESSNFVGKSGTSLLISSSPMCLCRLHYIKKACEGEQMDISSVLVQCLTPTP